MKKVEGNKLYQSVSKKVKKVEGNKLYLYFFELSVNSYKPGDLSYGTQANSLAPNAKPQNAASHLGLFCLLRGIS